MSNRFRHRIVICAVAGAIACAARGPVAYAAPPMNKLAVSVMHASDSGPASSAAVRLPRSRLDLAAPALSAPPAERAAATAFAPRRGAASPAPAGLSGLAIESTGRLMSRPEMLARNFKREGLPVARLFQSENSLVHVGLSPKGKPGLWFVEKLH
jgi:hypothetical protein